MLPPPYRGPPTVPPPPGYQPWHLPYPPPPPPSIPNPPTSLPHILRLPETPQPPWPPSLIEPPIMPAMSLQFPDGLHHGGPQFTPWSSPFPSPHQSGREGPAPMRLPLLPLSPEVKSWRQQPPPPPPPPPHACKSSDEHYLSTASGGPMCSLSQASPLTTLPRPSFLRQQHYHDEQPHWEARHAERVTPNAAVADKLSGRDVAVSVSHHSEDRESLISGNDDDEEDVLPSLDSNEFWSSRLHVRPAGNEGLGVSRFRDAPTVVLKLSSLNFSWNSPQLAEFVDRFLPNWSQHLDLGYPVGYGGTFQAEIFLLQSQLDAKSLKCVLDGVVHHGLIPSALHLGSNPTLGPEGVQTLADYIKRSVAPLRWVALSKCAAYQPLFEAIVERSDIYPRSGADRPAPVWIDLGAIEDDKVYEYLDKLELGLYCQATDRSTCGLSRCSASGVLMHIPKPTRQRTTVDHHSDHLSVVSSNEAREENSDTAFSEINSDDEDESEEFGEKPFVGTSIPTVSFDNVLESCSRCELLLEEEEEEEQQDEKAEVPEDSGARTSSYSTVVPSSAVPSTLQYVYYSLLRHAFVKVSLIAASRDILPVDFIRDLTEVFVKGVSVNDLPVPPLWQLQPPALLAAKLLHEESKEEPRRKRPRSTSVETFVKNARTPTVSSASSVTSVEVADSTAADMLDPAPAAPNMDSDTDAKGSISVEVDIEEGEITEEVAATRSEELQLNYNGRVT